MAVEGHREHQIVVQLLGMDTGRHVFMADEPASHLTIVVDPALLAAARLTDLLVELLHRGGCQTPEQGLCPRMSRRDRHQNKRGNEPKFLHEVFRIETTPV